MLDSFLASGMLGLAIAIAAACMSPPGPHYQYCLGQPVFGKLGALLHVIIVLL